MNKLVVLVFFVFLVGNLFAICEDEQININSASLSKLDELYGVGEAKAQNIVDSRPYETLDDLINAKGIGEITLENIKNQGLACVDEETSNEEKVQTGEDEEVVKEDKKVEETTFEKQEFVEKVDNTKRDAINLNPKDIKTESNSEKISKNNYAAYGFITFCVLLLFLFVLKKRNYKNEFR